jgi:hypothetical protein
VNKFKKGFIFGLAMKSKSMIGKTKVFILLMFFIWVKCEAQQLTNQVLLPWAGVTSSGVVNYSQSVGETAVELFSASDFILTQGFQQPRFKLPAGEVPSGTGVEVYPNPATDFINVKLFGEQPRKMKIELIAFNGSILSTLDLDFTTKYYVIQPIGLSRFKIGIYLVRVSSDDGVISRIFKIEKM